MGGRTIYPVILSGGVGTRLWPKARTSSPKQFLALHGIQTLIQQAVQRAALPDAAAPIIICGENHRFLVAEQMLSAGIAPHTIVVEPEGRSTAPAAAIAALMVCEVDPNGIVLLLPSDHAIDNKTAFHDAVSRAGEVANDGCIVTIGVEAKSPETGYGYIEKGEALSDGGAYRVRRFVEKPNLQTAKKLIENGDHFWNSGIFICRADKLLKELGAHAPDIIEACQAALAHAVADPDFIRLNRDDFARAPNVSFDVAVMEKTENAAVVPCDMAWSDVGNWAAIWRLGAKDIDGNVIQGEVCLLDTQNSLVHGGKRLIALVGVQNLAVIATDDAVLVADLTRAQDVRKLVELLKMSQRPETEVHAKVERPWGSYESLATDTGYQVKRIVVKPGGQLSLQMHHRRAEHWVVVSGTARVTRDDEVLTLMPNQAIFIPLGAKHRLENQGDIPLQLIEVQCGDYLGEDDIVRFEDVYGRADANKA